VVLDELPLIGSFVEIEGPDVASIEAVRRTLGLDAEPLLTDSYAAMLSAEIARRGLSSRELKF
jgi:adenylate cyclase class IV